MALEYKDLVRLQFWILAVILLGFLEKVFFVAEYGSANNGMDCEEHLDRLSIFIFSLSLSLSLSSAASGLIYVAEIVSAGKRALSRVLLIIVCEGFGTVK